MTVPSAPRRAYRIAEVAESLGVDPSTVSRWAADGRLTSVRIGGVVLIRPEHLEQFLDGHTEGRGHVPARARSTRPVKGAASA
jgi:excisionase family DNA binding protein